jgi:hypothetical protein
MKTRHAVLMHEALMNPFMNHINTNYVTKHITKVWATICDGSLWDDGCHTRTDAPVQRVHALLVHYAL